jgi:hypothetical protein
MCALCCIIFIYVEITKETECRRIKTPSGKTGLAIVIVGLAVVIVGLALTSPKFNHTKIQRRCMECHHNSSSYKGYRKFPSVMRLLTWNIDILSGGGDIRMHAALNLLK